MAIIPTVNLSLVKKYSTDEVGYIKIKVWVPGKKIHIPKPTGYKVPQDMWDEENEIVLKAFPKADIINREILKEKNHVIELLEQDLKKEIEFTELHIKSRLKPHKVEGDFLRFFWKYVEYIRSKFTEGYADHWESDYNMLVKYAGEHLSFSDITSDWLEAYEMSMSDYAATTKHGKFKRLKELIDRAIARELIRPKAVADFNYPEAGETEPIYLTLEEVKAIEHLLYESGDIDDDLILRSVCAYFLVECHSGIRFSDWNNFEIEKLINNRSFKVGRTQKNKKTVYLRLDIFQSLDRVVKFISDNKIVMNIDYGTVSKHLKLLPKLTKPKIKKHITTHVGRHTFGTLLGEKGYSTAKIAEAMGISEQTAKIYVTQTKRGFDFEMEKYGAW